MGFGYPGVLPLNVLRVLEQQARHALTEVMGVWSMSVQIHPEPSNVRPGHRDPHAHAAHQPFEYPLTRAYAEPDWTRLPAYRDIATDQWESAQWQRATP